MTGIKFGSRVRRWLPGGVVSTVCTDSADRYGLGLVARLIS
ncbi:MAG: hypothetical protein Ct9H300mP16_03720 [Pseudomonadota bacterium]|nr:MAG: hypothetical protein Ct9H300mP16_03720 [Pseudomonadota bacterium]